MYIFLHIKNCFLFVLVKVGVIQKQLQVSKLRVSPLISFALEIIPNSNFPDEKITQDRIMSEKGLDRAVTGKRTTFYFVERNDTLFYHNRAYPQDY
jgi:hypothetical protein